MIDEELILSGVNRKNEKAWASLYEHFYAALCVYVNRILKGSEIVIDPEKIGYETCAYIGIYLKDPESFDSVTKALEAIPEVVECHFTTGPYTMLTKLYACDNEHLMDLLNNKMQEIPGVVATETLISLEQSIKKEIPIRVEK